MLSHTFITSSPKLTNNQLLIAIPIVVAISAWFITIHIQTYEYNVFQQLLSFGLSNRSMRLTGIPLAIQQAHADYENIYVALSVLILFSTAGFWSGYKLNKLARTLSFLQLFAMIILTQWLLWLLFHINGHPISTFLALILGIICGYYFKIVNQHEKRHEAQYYELLIRNKELVETRLQMVKQDEIERRTLAADLHDQVLNDLKSIKQKITEYRKSPTEEAATSIEKLLQQTMSEVREVMESLCPSILEHLGLIPALEDCIRKGSERAGFKIRFKNHANSTDLANLSAVEMSMLYRLVQESITNICKHANASTVYETIYTIDEQLVITIEDDGKGIKPGQLQHESRGLRYMRQRADLIGANITWKSSDNGKGTIVEIRLNLAR